MADALLDSARPGGLLLDQGFRSRAWVAAQAARGTHVVLTPGRAEQLGLARHGAKTVWGLRTRTAATILAHTLQLFGLT